MTDQHAAQDPGDDTTPDPETGHDAGALDEEAPTRWDEGRHPVHIAHLVMGIAFAGILVVWALLWVGAVDGGAARWLLPLPWLLAGGAGLAAAGRSARRRA